jgi:hypothetical protein
MHPWKSVFLYQLYPFWRSLFHVDTIQVILAVKINTDLSCEAFSENLQQILGYWRRYILQINTRPLQGLPLQNSQGTVEIIMPYILHYYIITFIVSVHMLVHYFHVPYPITFIIYVLLHFTDLNLLILPNNTNIKNRVYFVPFKWKHLLQLPPVTLEWLSPKMPRKKMLTLPYSHIKLWIQCFCTSVHADSCYSCIKHNKDFKRILTMVYNTQNYRVFGLCPSSGILKTREQCFRNWICFHLQVRGETPPLIGPLERVNLNHWSSSFQGTE